MSSKKKPNGTTTVRCIEAAAKHANVSLEAFFLAAANKENELRSERNRVGRIKEPLLPIDAETIEAQTEAFRDFKATGRNIRWFYEIPAHVIMHAQCGGGKPVKRRLFHRNHGAEKRALVASSAH